jgi:hypothetical protein
MLETVDIDVLERKEGVARLGFSLGVDTRGINDSFEIEVLRSLEIEGVGFNKLDILGSVIDGTLGLEMPEMDSVGTPGSRILRNGMIGLIGYRLEEKVDLDALGTSTEEVPDLEILANGREGILDFKTFPSPGADIIGGDDFGIEDSIGAGIEVAPDFEMVCSPGTDVFGTDAFEVLDSSGLGSPGSGADGELGFEIPRSDEI